MTRSSEEYEAGYDAGYEDGHDDGMQDGFDVTLTKLVRHIEGKRQPTADDIITLRWLTKVANDPNHIARS
jgi:hypothetical protein